MKVGLVSLGCPKNLVDSEVMLGLAQERGHEVTANPADAEVLVVNTCAFIDSAKQESVDAILEMAKYKTNGECKRLIVTGCLAERYREDLRNEIAEVDAILGTGEVPDILKAIEGVTAPSQAAPLSFYRSAPKGSDPPQGRREGPSYIYDADTPRLLATPPHYAYVKIAEGCDYACAFCIIPTLRGSYRSRPAESIVREAEALAERGVKELLLVSQDTTFYGIDHHERGALGRLLRRLNTIEGLEWIRLLYLYPTTIDQDTLEAMADCEKVCNYIDLPLQHASAAVLKRMRRPGTRRTYERLLARIRRTVPGVALRTTFIVGFPGETEADMDELADFVRDQAFDHVGVFTYSHEQGTSAYSLRNNVPAETKRARRTRIMRLQKRLVSRRQRGRLGQTVRVLVDGPADGNRLVMRGRIASQAPDIDAAVYLTECDPSAIRAGEVIAAQVVGAKDYDLIARPAML